MGPFSIEMVGLNLIFNNYGWKISSDRVFKFQIYSFIQLDGGCLCSYDRGPKIILGHTISIYTKMR